MVVSGPPETKSIENKMGQDYSHIFQLYSKIGSSLKLADHWIQLRIYKIMPYSDLFQKPLMGTPERFELYHKWGWSRVGVLEPGDNTYPVRYTCDPSLGPLINPGTEFIKWTQSLIGFSFISIYQLRSCAPISFSSLLTILFLIASTSLSVSVFCGCW